MDNLAHTLIGIGVARAGLSQKYGKGTTLTVAIASNLPDVDALYAIWDGWDRFLLRRTHTHAFVALPVLAGLLTVVLWPRLRHIPWKALFGLSLLGLLLHDFFDVVNSFGVVLLWPFTRERFELASVFIIDPTVWALMIGPMAAGRFLKEEGIRVRMYRAACVALGVYVALCVAGHARAETMIRAVAVSPRAVKVFPEPLGPHRFRAAVLQEGAWTVYLCNPLTGALERKGIHPVDQDSLRVAEVRATPRGKTLDWFMAAPVWTLEPGGAVTVYDLRFRSLRIPRGDPLRVTFPAGSLEGRVD